MKDFGGGWTEKKLEKVNSYLKAYMRALKNKNFKKIYIDAFAGEGYRGSNHDNCHDEEKLLGLEELEDLDAAKVLKAGSAIVALKIKPPFDKYIFIEKEQEKCAKLKDIIKSDYAELEDRTEIIQDDANHALRIICKNMGNYDRAVLFLDPFGMQVELPSIDYYLMMLNSIQQISKSLISFLALMTGIIDFMKKEKMDLYLMMMKNHMQELQIFKILKNI